MRSRVTLARIDAAEMLFTSASPPITASLRIAERRAAVAVDFHERRHDRQPFHRALHRQHRGVQDIQRIDFLDRGRRDAISQRALDDLVVQLVALFGGEHLRIVEPANHRFRRIENHRSSHDRTRQRAAPGFVDAADDVVRRRRSSGRPAPPHRTLCAEVRASVTAAPCAFRRTLATTSAARCAVFCFST